MTLELKQQTRSILGTPSTQDGWGYPVSAHKKHYIRNSNSLCGRHFIPLSLWIHTIPTDYQMEKHCKECEKRLARLRGRYYGD